MTRDACALFNEAATAVGPKCLLHEKISEVVAEVPPGGQFPHREVCQLNILPTSYLGSISPARFEAFWASAGSTLNTHERGFKRRGQNNQTTRGDPTYSSDRVYQPISSGVQSVFEEFWATLQNWELRLPTK